jgi:hypothetical protein
MIMRSPVVVAPDEDRPADGWIVGDSFFFGVGKDILNFTVTSIDDKIGLLTTHGGVEKKNPITGESPLPHVAAYLERIRNKDKDQSEADRIWKAVQDFGKGRTVD